LCSGRELRARRRIDKAPRYDSTPSKLCSNLAALVGEVGDRVVFTMPENFGMDGTIAGNSGRFRRLQFSNGAVVLLIMFGHGAASTTDNRYLARQLLTLQLPLLGAPGLGAPADGSPGHGIAVAAFNVPEH